MSDDERCSHPWLRVTCGVCGEAVDALGADHREGRRDQAADHATAARTAAEEPSRTLFIVARGHPELVEQLRSVMGHESGVQIIEDRRRRPRDLEPTARETRAELRRLVREDEEDPGPA